MNNAQGRLAEAYTGPSASKITDLGFSYTARGEVSDIQEKTPHSVTFYHVAATYWANGLLNTLSSSIPGFPTAYYCPEGEGRAASVSTASSCATTNYLASNAAYNVFGGPTEVTLGSNDSDAFNYDSNTGRMTQYKFTVNSSSVIGNLTWNANGTLQQLAVTDPFNSNNQQTCTYGYDAQVRMASANCVNGSTAVWKQNYSFTSNGTTTGAFGNPWKIATGGQAINFTFWFDNKWLHRLHLAPATGLMAQITVSHGVVMRRRLLFGSIYVPHELLSDVSVDEVTALPTGKRFEVNDPRGWRSHTDIELTPAAAREECNSAFGLDLSCLSRFGGCKDSLELLPSLSPRQHLPGS